MASDTPELCHGVLSINGLQNIWTYITSTLNFILPAGSTGRKSDKNTEHKVTKLTFWEMVCPTPSLSFLVVQRSELQTVAQEGDGVIHVAACTDSVTVSG